MTVEERQEFHSGGAESPAQALSTAFAAISQGL